MNVNPNAMMSKRDLRIDFFRGLALVMIFANHVPGNPLSALTQRNWGLSDSADVFVLLAGLSSALAYSKYFERVQPVPASSRWAGGLVPVPDAYPAVSGCRRLVRDRCRTPE